MENFLTVVGTAVVVVLVAGLIAAVISVITMLLWNWLMPVIFGLPALTWVQAWGLTWLSGILFKSSGSSNKN